MKLTSQSQNSIKIIVTMAIPVHQLTMEEAHKESNYLVDKNVAMFEQLDAGEFWAFGTQHSLLNLSI